MICKGNVEKSNQLDVVNVDNDRRVWRSLPFNLCLGTFHDWSLLLYGTADPAQPGDPVHPPSPTPPLGRVVQQLTSQVKAYLSSTSNVDAP